MALRTAQLAFDRILLDVEEKVLGESMGEGHEDLLRSFFQRDVGQSIPQTTSLTHRQQVEIAEKVRIILRHYCWINPDDPCWEVMTPRMIQHLNDVANSQQPVAVSSVCSLCANRIRFYVPKCESQTCDGSISEWAPPPPRSSHKGDPMKCTVPGCLPVVTTVAPLCHLAFQHGIDTPANRYVVREAHIKRMGRGIMVQHLVQDAGELNSLRADIQAVEAELKCVNPSYKPRHGLPLTTRDETDPNSPKFPSKDGPFKKKMTNMLIALRKSGMQQGLLYSRNKWGTYSEVLADLKEVLAQAKNAQGGVA